MLSGLSGVTGGPGTPTSISKGLTGQNAGTGARINPLIAVHMYGITLVEWVNSVWTGMMTTIIIIVTAGIVAAGIPFVSIGATILTGFLAIFMWLISLVMPLLLFAFTQGVLLAYYVPMIPFFIFTMLKKAFSNSKFLSRYRTAASPYHAFCKRQSQPHTFLLPS